MSLPEEKKVSLDEFYKIREETDRPMEYIDGVIFMAPSPSVAHQRISGRLYVKLFHLLEGKDCEVFHAPLDVEFSKGDAEDKKIVVPDLTVICDKDGLGTNKYSGSPTIVIEIISPSNQSHDLVTKMNLYMKHGVKEYWIVNPLLNAIQVYSLDEKGNYQQKDIAKDEGTVQSEVLARFAVDVGKLFE